MLICASTVHSAWNSTANSMARASGLFLETACAPQERGTNDRIQAHGWPLMIHIPDSTSLSRLLSDNFDGEGSVREEIDVATNRAIAALSAYNAQSSRRVLIDPSQARNTGDFVCPELQLLSLLGRSPSSEVWECVDWRRGQLVAVKCASNQAGDAMNRLACEARQLSVVSHPNLCATLDAFSTTGGTFVVLERLSRHNLHQRMRSFAERGIPVPPDQALDVVEGILQGLVALHESEMVHGDVKPANVCFGPDAKVKLIDLVDLKRVTAGGITGTDGWQSPEQAEDGLVGAPSDLFCLGIIAALLWGGPHPFVDPRHLISSRELVLGYPPQGLDAVPAAVRPWICRLLAQRPEDRYTGADALEKLREIKAKENLSQTT